MLMLLVRYQEFKFISMRRELSHGSVFCGFAQLLWYKIYSGGGVHKSSCRFLLLLHVRSLY